MDCHHAIAPEQLGEAKARPGWVRWKVYPLRKDGQKLSRADAFAGGTIGTLIINAKYQHACAYVLRPQGPELETLGQVRIRRLDGRGGMLLYGKEVRETATKLQEYPQAWWCVPQWSEA